MNVDALIGLATFAFVSSITPGPNNLMLMASGANYGVLRTVPHLLGVVLGFVFMIIVVGFGLAQVFDRWPLSHVLLQILSVLYLLYLACRIATAAPPARGAVTGRPLVFLQAAAFQWVNPKAWAMALTAIGVYATSRDAEDILLVSAIFGLINLPAVSSWTVLGQEMRRVLTNPVRLIWFNRLMAALLVLSLYPVLFD